MSTYIQLPSGLVWETDHPHLWKEGKQISKREGKAQLVDAARDYLREILRPGDTVYCVLRHVSRSGMYRRISLLASPKGGEPFEISRYALRLGIGSRPRRGEGVGVGGAGMDMGFALVYELAQTLWPQGFGCIGDSCPANDHSNGDRDYTPHGDMGHGAYNHWHKQAGGYALRHKWL